MTKRDDGGPAFGHGNHEQGGDPGMSLRDWFAGQALVGLLPAEEIAREEDSPIDRCATAREFAEASYEIADAMLTAREKRNDG